MAMSLILVATPIGNPLDLSPRAAETLKSVDLVIGEDRKPLHRLLTSLDLRNKEYELLNEHSTDSDIEELAKLCSDQSVALVSDCGTPGFCDPGPKLVAACRRLGIAVTTVPGVSSLATILSLSSRPILHFEFLGFPPADKELRKSFFQKLSSKKHPLVLMDTPYRLSKLLQELASVIGERHALLGMNLTQAEEQIVEGKISKLAAQFPAHKAEFMLLIY